MVERLGAAGASSLQEISVAQVNHLPIVAHFARRLGLVELVNELVPTQMAVEPGVIALGLVLDTLSGRSPLYHLQTAFEECDRGVLFGQELPAEYFSDDHVGRMLDCFFAAGTQRGFISRLPATYNEHERVILAAIEANDWQAVGHIAHTAPTKNRPGPFYRLHEGSVTIDGKTYRAVVVHSSAHDRRRLKRLERELEASHTEIVRLAKEAEKQTFFCRADAEAAAAQGQTRSTAYHLLEVSVEERPRFAPGRPKKGTPRLPVAIDYVLRPCITEQPEAILLHHDFDAEFMALDESCQEELLAHARLLTEFGPNLGRPTVDALKGSRYAKMKELRFAWHGAVWRVAFAFDPRRQAILLVGGDKGGADQRRFCRQLIAVADDRYGDHLASLTTTEAKDSRDGTKTR